MYNNEDNPLSKDSVIRMFQLYNHRDSLWKGNIVWAGVTEKIEKQPTLTVFVANSMVVFGIIAVVSSFIIRGIFGHIMYLAFIAVGIFFIISGLSLRLLSPSFRFRARRELMGIISEPMCITTVQNWLSRPGVKSWQDTRCRRRSPPQQADKL